jgi:coenzyme F420-0:L-glutamate ligase/coenzyme F420-1:gamma-L-glutamate ligase
VHDLRGSTDAGGQPLEVTERAIADEVAAAADLVKGKADGIPVAVVRGLAGFVTADDGPGATVLLRAVSADWFRLGHVESVWAALGVPLDQAESPSVLPESVQHRVSRAVQVALHGLERPAGLDVVVREEGIELLGDAFGCGLVAARLTAALWAEDLHGEVVTGYHDGHAEVRVRQRELSD